MSTLKKNCVCGPLLPFCYPTGYHITLSEGPYFTVRRCWCACLWPKKNWIHRFSFLIFLLLYFLRYIHFSWSSIENSNLFSQQWDFIHSVSKKHIDSHNLTNKYSFKLVVEFLTTGKVLISHCAINKILITAWTWS